MKLNNKGITLVELIVSIALISIVIMFLFRLLVDVRYSDSSIDYNRANQQKRAIILKTLQEDFLENKLIGLQDVTIPNTEELILNFTYADYTTGKLIVQSDSITYSFDNREVEKWTLEKENESTKFDIHCVKYSSGGFSEQENASPFFYIKFTIPVVTNLKSNNYIDDLEFFYLGKKQDITSIPTSNRSLGNYDSNKCG